MSEQTLAATCGLEKNPSIINVELAAHRYPIIVGHDLLDAAGGLIAAHINATRVIVISDRNVFGCHGARLIAALDEANLPFRVVIVEPGETSKSFVKLEQVVEQLVMEPIDRQTIILAFGGGVVGDLAGFAAAIVLRGLRLVQIPTSFLAQIDSSIGGKTGVNMPAGKNLVGAFHQPDLVIADISLLDTLPLREMRAGYAELVKSALISGESWLQWCEMNGAHLVKDSGALRRCAVVQACAFKALVVAEDEREIGENGRIRLNLGHTFAHAIEMATGYDGSVLHGEAVSVGLCLASLLSQRLERCHGSLRIRLETLLRAAGLPTSLRDLPRLVSARNLVSAMYQDKKTAQGRLRFVLCDRPGQVSVFEPVDPDEVMKLLLTDGARP